MGQTQSLGKRPQDANMKLSAIHTMEDIPENIIVLDLDGQPKFRNEFCRSWIKECNLTDDSLKQIKDLQLQPGFEEENENFKKFQAFQDLIWNFTNQIVQKSLQERQFFVYDGKLKREEGYDMSIEVKISSIQHSGEDYILLILRDTSERDLMVPMEKVNEYKDQLMGSISDDFRAPLHGNINLVESAINSTEVPLNIKEYLLIPAVRSAKSLLHIMNDMMDITQIKEHHQLRLVVQPGDLRETLKETVELVELQAAKKGISLVSKFDPQLPRDFCTDHVRLSQIVLNLLRNAVKFTKDGMVRLIAAPVSGTSFVKITVEDLGIGISSEDLNKIFEKFSLPGFEGRQAINSTGVGLGLSIASNLVELLAPQDHQKISVETVPNQGSVFSFLIEDKKSLLAVE